jgi:hypothetical protein
MVSIISESFFLSEEAASSLTGFVLTGVDGYSFYCDELP